MPPLSRRMNGMKRIREWFIARRKKSRRGQWFRIKDGKVEYGSDQISLFQEGFIKDGGRADEERFTAKIGTIKIQADSLEELTEKIKAATEGWGIASIGAIVGGYKIIG